VLESQGARVLECSSIRVFVCWSVRVSELLLSVSIATVRRC